MPQAGVNMQVVYSLFRNRQNVVSMGAPYIRNLIGIKRLGWYIIIASIREVAGFCNAWWCRTEHNDLR